MNHPRPLPLLVAAAAMSARAELVTYPEYPAQIERDYAYSVTVTQQGGETRAIPVYNHCEKSALAWRTHGGDVNRRFCEFAFSGAPVRVDIAVCEDVRSYAVFPSSRRLRSRFRDGVISVWLERPTLFGIRINDYDKTILSVFADPPEDPAKIPQKGDPGVLYVDGWLDATDEDGSILIQEPVREVYIAPGSVLNARLRVATKNAHIHGRGMVLDPFSDIFRFDQTKNTRRGVVNVSGDGTVVEDIKIVDSRTYNYCTWATGVTFRNVKALSSMMCSDGFTNGGTGLTVDGAWLYVGDNGLVVSGLRDSVYRDIAIGTSCNAVFPQNGNERVTLENIDAFRADEGLVKNTYNGVLRRNTKWNEMNTGTAKKERDPQDLEQQPQSFVIRNLCAVDCVLFSRFFVGGNMGTLPKTFVFENLSIPYPSGSDNWRSAGQTNGPLASIFHDPAKWLISDNYALTITNFWLGGERADAIEPERIKNGDRMTVSISNDGGEPAVPVRANRRTGNWTCPYKVYVGGALQRDWRLVDKAKGEQRLPAPPDGEDLLAERPSTRSAWQRCPSWMVKVDAMTTEGGARVYRLTQCEKGAGILNIFSDAFLRHGNGTYHLVFEAKATAPSPVPLEARFSSNEKTVSRSFTIANDGAWHRFEDDLAIDLDLEVSDLAGLFLKSDIAADEICFKNLSLVKRAGK